MEYWWKENKAVAIPVGAMGLVALVWWWWPLSNLRAEASTIQRKRQQAEQLLRVKMATGVPAEDSVSRATRDLDRLKKQVADMRGEMQIKVPDGYKAEGKSPSEFFVGQKRTVERRIADKASAAGVGIPGDVAGFPPMSEGMNDALGEELLLRLSIVEKLALVAIDTGVQKIESVSALVGVDSDPSDTTVRKELFLNRLTVRMRVVGSSKAVFEWLHRVQKKGDFLAVDDFKADKLNPLEDLFGAEMEVSALLINTAGVLVVEKERQ